jgi:hypothetical protein
MLVACLLSIQTYIRRFVKEKRIFRTVLAALPRTANSDDPSELLDGIGLRREKSRHLIDTYAAIFKSKRRVAFFFIISSGHQKLIADPHTVRERARDLSFKLSFL